jgi:hypothetical protein
MDLTFFFWNSLISADLFEKEWLWRRKDSGEFFLLCMKKSTGTVKAGLYLSPVPLLRISG